MTNITRVFISYAREDVTKAKRLYRDIDVSNTECWLDAKSLNPGDVWEEVIIRIINRVDVFLALTSKAALAKSGYMQKEVDLSLNRLRKKEDAFYVIPVRLDNTGLVYSKLARFESIDLFSCWDSGIEKIRTKINEIVVMKEKWGGIDLDPDPKIGAPSNVEIIVDNEFKV